MKFFTLSISILLLTIGNAAFAECKAPDAPMIPDGLNAEKDVIIAASVNVKAFLADSEDYRRCLKRELDTQGEEATPEQKAEWANKHDASVDSEEQVAAAYNAQIRIFKAR